MSNDADEGGPLRRVTLDGSGRSFDVAPGESVLDAARRAGAWLPYECGWGSCNRCKATLVEGELRYLFPEAPAIDARDERRRRFLLCQTTPVTDVVVKPLSVADEPAPERPTADYLGTVSDVRHLGPDIAEITMVLSTLAGDATVGDFLPGQYAVLTLGGGLRRCYSMAGLPGADTVSFIAKRYDGKSGSTAMLALKPGDQVPLTFPYGDMWLRDRDRPVLLIAGGTGISAILSLLRQISADTRWAERTVNVLYGAAAADELVCWDELHDLIADLPSARVHGALVEADHTWAGTRGFITETLTRLLDDEPGHDASLVYLAGPPPMVRAVQDVLAGYGIELDRIHVDSFG